METNPSLNIPALAAPLAAPQVTPALAPPMPGAPATAGGGNDVQQFDPQTGAPLSRAIAQNTITAGKMNPGNWAENTVAGAQSALAGISSALAGIGNIGTAPPGAGGLYGAGKVMQYQQEQKQLRLENQMKQKQLAQQQTNADREYQLRLAENARQQTKSVADMSEHDLRMKNLNQENSIHQFELTKAEADFRQSQLDREEALKRVGAKPLQVAGQNAPVFNDLGEAEKYATDNGLAGSAVQNGYRTRVVFGADSKYHLYEVPDEGIKQFTMKDPSGKDIKITTDPLGALNYAEKVSQIHHTSAEANELNAKAATERMAAGMGTDTDKAIAISGAYDKVQKDPAFQALPKNPDTGRVDDQTPEYKKYMDTSDLGKNLIKVKGEGVGYNTSTGEPYIQTLSPAVGGTVRAIGEGREGFDALPRGKEKSAYVNYLNRAYPGFDESEQKNYFSARQKFTTGTQGQAVNAGMTAFHHLKELQDLNTPQSRIPGTPDYVNYQNKIETIAGELANFYGTNTVSGIDNLKKSLDNYTFRDTAIQTQAHSMTDKMNEYGNQWSDSVPKYLQKAGVHPVMPGYDKTAIADRDSILKIGQSGAPPKGSTGVAPGNDGKFYYHDAQGTALGQAPAPAGH